MVKKYFAHSVEGKPVEEWHHLEDHLKDTAELAAKLLLNSNETLDFFPPQRR